MIKKDITNSIKNDETLLLCLLVSSISANKLRMFKDLLIFYKEKKISSVKIYESILQTYLFCGFPVTIEALKQFNSVFPGFKKPRYKFNLLKYEKLGLKNCKKIYRANYSKLISNFKNLSSELKDWMIIEGYGKVMGRKGLTLRTRELLNVSILATNYYEHQLYSHIKGSINTGSSFKRIKEVIDTTRYFSCKRNYNKSIQILNKIVSNDKK